MPRLMPRPMPRLMSPWGVALLAALLLLTAADALTWNWATHRLERNFATWSRQRTREGWTLRHGPPRRAGFPFSAELILPDFAARPPGPLGLPGPAGCGAHLPPAPTGATLCAGRVTWRAASLVLRLPPLLPPRIEAVAHGAQSFAVGAFPPVPFHAATMTLRLSLTWHGQIRAARLAVAALRGDPGGRAAGLTVRAARLRVARGPDRRMTMAFRIADIALPKSRIWPLGRRIAEVSASGWASAPPRGGGPARARLERWRRAGGTVRLTAARLRWDQLDLSASARLGLDPLLRPEGEGMAMVAGYAPALDTLAANGALSNDAALAAKGVLSLLAAAGPQGGQAGGQGGAHGAPAGAPAGALLLPFVLRDGRLMMDGMPLARLPPVVGAGNAGGG